MITSDFIKGFILPHENVYGKDGNGNRVVIAERDPQDPGGVTKYGIDQRSHPHVSIPDLTEVQAIQIYLQEFSELTFNLLDDQENAVSAYFPGRSVYAFFDTRVNLGVKAAWIIAQRAAGCVDDGSPGPKTAAAIKRTPEDNMCAGIINRRKSYYRSLPSPKFDKYQQGWLNRCNDLQTYLINNL